MHEVLGHLLSAPKYRTTIQFFEYAYREHNNCLKNTNINMHNVYFYSKHCAFYCKHEIFNICINVLNASIIR